VVDAKPGAWRCITLAPEPRHGSALTGGVQRGLNDWGEIKCLGSSAPDMQGWHLNRTSFTLNGPLLNAECAGGAKGSQQRGVQRFKEFAMSLYWGSGSSVSGQAM